MTCELPGGRGPKSHTQLPVVHPSGSQVRARAHQQHFCYPPWFKFPPSKPHCSADRKHGQVRSEGILVHGRAAELHATVNLLTDFTTSCKHTHAAIGQCCTKSSAQSTWQAQYVTKNEGRINRDNKFKWFEMILGLWNLAVFLHSKGRTSFTSFNAEAQ